MASFARARPECSGRRSRARRVQALIYVMFVGIIASLLGVVFKADIYELWFEQTIVRPLFVSSSSATALPLSATAER